jgi:hypothetical protein
MKLPKGGLLAIPILDGGGGIEQVPILDDARVFESKSKFLFLFPIKP